MGIASGLNVFTLEINSLQQGLHSRARTKPPEEMSARRHTHLVPFGHSGGTTPHTGSEVFFVRCVTSTTCTLASRLLL